MFTIGYGYRALEIFYELRTVFVRIVEFSSIDDWDVHLLTHDWSVKIKSLSEVFFVRASILKCSFFAGPKAKFLLQENTFFKKIFFSQENQLLIGRDLFFSREADYWKNSIFIVKRETFYADAIRPRA